MTKKPLVLPDIRSRAGAFVAQWRDAEGYERGEAQSFVRDLLRVFGITRSTAAVYEKRAQRASTALRTISLLPLEPDGFLLRILRTPGMVYQVSGSSRR